MESPGALKRKRKDLTLAAKMQVIQLAEMKISQVAISRSLGCSQSQISRLLSRKNDILQEYLANKNPFRKRKRFGKALDVEEALAAWFTEVTNKGVHISTQILLAKAKELACQLDKPDFKPSNGWLSRWKLRNLVSVQRNKNDERVSEKEATERWMDHMFPMLMQEYNTWDVFCVAETEIYQKSNPNGDKPSYEDDINDVKDKLNVLIACNATGLEKRPLFVVGQSELEPNSNGTLPTHTEYTSNEKEFTSTVFIEWLNKLDEEMGKNGRKIALVLDDCPPHPRNDSVSLSNVMLVFNSPQGEPDCSINPCQNGIISTLKALFYEHLLVRSTNDSENITLSDTITVLSEAWDAMLPDTISKSFIEAGFKLPMADKQKYETAVTRHGAQEALLHEIEGRQNVFNISPNTDPDQPTIKVEVDLDDDFLTSYKLGPSPATTEQCSSPKGDLTSLHCSYAISTSTSTVTATTSALTSKRSLNQVQVVTPKPDKVVRGQTGNEEPPTKKHKTCQSKPGNTKVTSSIPKTNQHAGKDDVQAAGQFTETNNICPVESSNDSRDKQPATNISSSNRCASADGRSPPTNTEVMRALTTVRRYMEMNGGMSEYFYVLEDHIMDLMEQNPE